MYKLFPPRGRRDERGEGEQKTEAKE